MPVTRRTAVRAVAIRTVHEFSRHGCTDSAAALAFHTVLAAAPAVLALVSVVGLFGQAREAVVALLDVVAPLAPGVRLDRSVGPLLDGLARSPAAPVTFVIGVAGAVWSASSYTTAFARAMDRVWGVLEGRSYLRLRLELAVLTLVLLALASLGTLVAVVPTEVVRAVGASVGAAGGLTDAYGLLKPAVLALLAVLALSLLYWWTPAVRPPRLRLLSRGAALALLLSGALSAGLAAYVAGFDRYQATYGSIGSVIVLLLWLWLTNLALLLGAELDAESERMRELVAGEPAERRILLPVRDAQGVDRARQRTEEDEGTDRAIRRGRRPPR